MRWMRWMREEKGANLVEYLLLATLIVIIILVAIHLAGEDVAEAIQDPGVVVIDATNPMNQLGIHQIEVELADGSSVTCLWTTSGEAKVLSCDWPSRAKVPNG